MYPSRSVAASPLRSVLPFRASSARTCLGKSPVRSARMCHGKSARACPGSSASRYPASNARMCLASNVAASPNRSAATCQTRSAPTFPANSAAAFRVNSVSRCRGSSAAPPSPPTGVRRAQPNHSHQSPNSPTIRGLPTPAYSILPLASRISCMIFITSSIYTQHSGLVVTYQSRISAISKYTFLCPIVLSIIYSTR